MSSKCLIKYLLLINCMLACNIAAAAPRTVAVYLTNLVAQNTSDQKPIRLYFSLTEYPSAGVANEKRIPEYPEHWLLEDLPKIKDVKLWQGTIDDNNSVNLVFSLMDQKIPLLESDCLMGVIQVEIYNKNNKIASYWCKAKNVDPTMVEQPDPKRTRFIMYGGEYPYVVTFKVKTVK